MTDLSPRDTEIQRRWLLGQSTGFIAKALHVTRNTISGIVHRRGWAREPAAKVQLPYPQRDAKVARRRIPTERLEQPPRPKGKPQKPIEPSAGTGVALEHLRHRAGCRWTDSTQSPYLFCNAPGYPWCKFHESICFTVSRVRERDLVRGVRRYL